MTVVSLLAGFALLVGGAEFLVKGAAAIATHLGIRPVVIGLTVVAFGTSAPEFAVSIGAAATGSTDVAFGNVVGSNIANILLILGASALIGGLAVTQRIIRFDIPLLIVVSVVALLMALDGRIGRLDGVILFIGILVYTAWLIRASRAERAEITAEYSEAVELLEGDTVGRSLPIQILLALGGLVALIVGSQFLVSAATDIAETLGLSELVIGLTVVAIGTSLPELATSLLAAWRGERDIAVGNVVGSNLFNLLGVLGISGVIAADGIPVASSSLTLDFPVMLAATIALVPIIWNGFRIRRWEGLVLLVSYIVYVTYLILDTSEHRAADVVGPAALIVTPIVLMTLGVTGFQGWRRHRRDAAEGSAAR